MPASEAWKAKKRKEAAESLLRNAARWPDEWNYWVEWNYLAKLREAEKNDRGRKKK